MGVDLAADFSGIGMNPVRRSAALLSVMCADEIPVILPGEKLVFTRTIREIPDIYTVDEWRGIKENYYIHERGTVCNISPDYETTIRKGLEARKEEVTKRLKEADQDAERIAFPIFLTIGGTYIFGMFSIVALGSLVFAIKLTETKGKSLEEIQKELVA